MTQTRGKDQGIKVEINAPIWQEWANQVLDDFTDGKLQWFSETGEINVSQGKKGEPMPYGQKHLNAALLLTLYPRGFTTINEVAKASGCSHGSIRTWRLEQDFKNLVNRLETEFALYVLDQMKDYSFILKLRGADSEPQVWSDTILSVFTWKVADALGFPVEDVFKMQVLVAAYSGQIRYENRLKNLLSTPLSPGIGILRSLVMDLLEKAFVVQKTKVGRGRKPHQTVETPAFDSQTMLGGQLALNEPSSHLREAFKLLEGIYKDAIESEDSSTKTGIVAKILRIERELDYAQRSIDTSLPRKKKTKKMTPSRREINARRLEDLESLLAESITTSKL